STINFRSEVPRGRAGRVCLSKADRIVSPRHGAIMNAPLKMRPVTRSRKSSISFPFVELPGTQLLIIQLADGGQQSYQAWTNRSPWFLRWPISPPSRYEGGSAARSRETSPLWLYHIAGLPIDFLGYFLSVFASDQRVNFCPLVPPRRPTPNLPAHVKVLHAIRNFDRPRIRCGQIERRKQLEQGRRVARCTHVQ